MKKLSMQRQQNLTFLDASNEYVCDCKARNLRNGTISHYEQTIKTLCHYVPAQTNVNDLTIETFNGVIMVLRSNEAINDVSLFSYARDLKTLMRFFMRKEYIPNFKITLPKADKEPIVCYTNSELALLLKKPDKKKCSFSEYKNWVIVNFLLSTGIRRNSLINIKIKDIDFDNEVVNINVTKNRKILIIPLNGTIVKIIKEYLTLRCHKSDDEYLFCNVYGKQLTRSTIYHGLYEYNKSRNVDTTGMHRFRHTFAKKWIMAGGNVVTLSKILGHSSLDITQNYINILISDLKSDMNKFNILEEFEKQYIKIGK